MELLKRHEVQYAMKTVDSVKVLNADTGWIDNKYFENFISVGQDNQSPNTSFLFSPDEDTFEEGFNRVWWIFF